MKIKISFISSEEAAASARHARNALEDALNQYFSDKNYGGGVGLFSFVLVAVDDQSDENEKYARNLDKIGYDVDVASKKRIRYISTAIQTSPSLICQEKNPLKFLCELLQGHVVLKGYLSPAKFDAACFCNDFVEATELLGKSSGV